MRETSFNGKPKATAIVNRDRRPRPSTAFVVRVHSPGSQLAGFPQTTLTAIGVFVEPR